MWVYIDVFSGAKLHHSRLWGGPNDEMNLISQAETYVLKIWISLISAGTRVFLSFISWQLCAHVLKPGPLLLTLDICDGGWPLKQ